MNPYMVRIASIFTREYSDFLEYCDLADKEFAEDLTPADYVAFRSQYGWSREAAEEIRLEVERRIAAAPDAAPVEQRERDPYASSANAKEHFFPAIKPPDPDSSETSSGRFQSTLPPNSKRRFLPAQELQDPDFSDTPYYIRFQATPSDFADTSIETLPLKTRSSGVLKRRNIQSVEQLLMLSGAEIFEFQQAGKGVVQDIAKCLSAYLSAHAHTARNDVGIHPDHDAVSSHVAIREAFAQAVRTMLQGAPCDPFSLTEDETKLMERCTRSKEAIGADACLWALENPEKIRPVVSSLLEFGENFVRKAEFLNRVQREIAKLPSSRQSNKVAPYLRYCAEDFPELERITESVSEDMDVCDMPSFLGAYWERNGGIDADAQAETLSFLQWLNYDFKALAQSLRQTLDRRERARYVIEQRAQGATLGQVGLSMDLTRERVRQMESKITRSLLHSLTHGKYKLLPLLYLENGGKSVLCLEDLQARMDPDLARILWYLVKNDARTNIMRQFTALANREDKKSRYDADSDAILFSEKADLEQEERLKKALRAMPDVFFEREREKLLAATAAQYNLPVRLLRERVSIAYDLDGVCYHCGRLTVPTMCMHILKECFPNGYKIADESDQQRFLSALRETFGEGGKITPRALDAKIGSLGFLCDRGKYVHPDSVTVSESLMEEVNRYIEESPRTVLPYAEIYQDLSERFLGTPISNRYRLQGALRKYGCPFVLRKDYVTKNRDMSMTEEFDRFVKARGEVYKADIFEEFSAFSDAHITFLMNRCPEIIALGDGRYMHASHLRCSDNERVKMETYLKKICDPVPISARSLLNDFTLRFTDFMSRNNVDAPGKLFGILQYLFRDTFHFSRPYIALEDTGKITRREALLRLLDGCDSIEISDAMQICAENGTLIHSSTDLVRIAQPDYLRISQTMLMRRDLTGLTDEVLESAVQYIQEAVDGNDGYCAARNITDYSWYPSIRVEWNPFVLESVAVLSGDALHILYVPSTATDTPLGVFVGEQYAEDDLNAVIVKVLSEEHRREAFTSQGEVLQWLREQGLCNIKLPEFLERDGYLFSDENGTFQVREYGQDDADTF